MGSSSAHYMCCFGVVCYFCCRRHFLSARRASSPSGSGSGSGSSLLQRRDLAAKRNRANAAMRIDSPRGSGCRCHGVAMAPGGGAGVGAGLHAKRQRGRSEPACVHLIYLGSEESADNNPAHCSHGAPPGDKRPSQVANQISRRQTEPLLEPTLCQSTFPVPTRFLDYTPPRPSSSPPLSCILSLNISSQRSMEMSGRKTTKLLHKRIS